MFSILTHVSWAKWLPVLRFESGEGDFGEASGPPKPLVYEVSYLWARGR